MTEQEEQALRTKVEDLERLALVTVEALGRATAALQALQVQSAASMYVAAVTAGHLKGLGMLDAKALTQIAISNLPGGAEAQPECAKLIRNMLCGEKLPEAPPMPKLTVIHGGKADAVGPA